MSEHPVKRRKKLIEVAIPLEAINAASAREKSIRHGHPSTLHLWWARRPLAAARAVIFCQMVDDPSAVPEEFPTEEAQENKRLRLFALISELVQWENTTNEQVLNRAREEIRRSWRRCCADNADHPDSAELFNPEKLPGFHDPFAGGGALPLEAQRLGLKAYASDLNPVAVLINKAMIEIPPKFAGMPPMNPEARSKKQLIERQWKGAEGLAEDVRYYGKWMRDEAEKRIGHLYPKVKITSEMVNNPENPRPDLRQYKESELTVIAYIWARAVRSPNPAYSQTEVPLASTFILSKMKGKEARIVPIVGDHNFGLAIEVGHRNGMEEAKAGTKLSRGANFQCLMSGAPISSDYIKDEGAAGRMGAILIAVVAEGNRERVYLPPTPEMQAIALEARPEWRPETPLPDDPRNFWTPAYGLSTYADLFTSRQLVALTTFSALAQEAREKVLVDALAAGDESRGKDYADAVGVFLGLVVSSQSDRMSTICTWDAGGPTWGTKTRNTFARQAIPMSWDFAEVNPLSTQSGSFDNSLDYTSKGILCAGRLAGTASQVDASTQNLSEGNVVSTDPPYYDNIAYADLSDFFYVWLRHSLRSVLPQLFATLAVPKGNELVATPYRHGGKESADNFFLGGMTKAM